MLDCASAALAKALLDLTRSPQETTPGPLRKLRARRGSCAVQGAVPQVQGFHEGQDSSQDSDDDEQAWRIEIRKIKSPVATEATKKTARRLSSRKTKPPSKNPNCIANAKGNGTICKLTKAKSERGTRKKTSLGDTTGTARVFMPVSPWTPEETIRPVDSQLIH